MSMGASKWGLANSSSGKPGTASWMQGTSTAAEVAVEMLPEDSTHTVECHWIHAGVEEAKENFDINK